VYNTIHTILACLYLYKHVLNGMGICFSKKEKKTYIFVKSVNQDETKDKII
jgi:hypothetical protein